MVWVVALIFADPKKVERKDWLSEPEVFDALESWLTRDVIANSKIISLLSKVNSLWRKQVGALMHDLDKCPRHTLDTYLRIPNHQAKPSMLVIHFHRFSWSVDCFKAVTDLWPFHFKHFKEIHLVTGNTAETWLKTQGELLNLIKVSKVIKIVISNNYVGIAGRRLQDRLMATILRNFRQFPSIKYLDLQVIPSLHQKTTSILARVLRLNQLEGLNLRINIYDDYSFIQLLWEMFLHFGMTGPEDAGLADDFINQKTVDDFDRTARNAKRLYIGARINWSFEAVCIALKSSSIKSFGLELSVEKEDAYNPRASLEVMNLLMAAPEGSHISLNLQTFQPTLIMLAAYPRVSRLKLRLVDLNFDGLNAVVFAAKVLTLRSLNGFDLKELSWEPLDFFLEGQEIRQIVAQLPTLGLKTLRWRFLRVHPTLDELGKALQNMPTLKNLELDLYFADEPEIILLLSQIRNLPSIRNFTLRGIRGSLLSIQELKRLPWLVNLERLHLSFLPNKFNPSDNAYWMEILNFIADMPSLKDVMIFPASFTQQLESARLAIPLLIKTQEPAHLKPLTLESFNGYRLPMTLDECFANLGRIFYIPLPAIETSNLTDEDH